VQEAIPKKNHTPNGIERKHKNMSTPTQTSATFIYTHTAPMGGVSFTHSLAVHVHRFRAAPASGAGHRAAPAGGAATELDPRVLLHICTPDMMASASDNPKQSAA